MRFSCFTIGLIVMVTTLVNDHLFAMHGLPPRPNVVPTVVLACVLIVNGVCTRPRWRGAVTRFLGQLGSKRGAADELQQAAAIAVRYTSLEPHHLCVLASPPTLSRSLTRR